jgi:hypothetical protein
MKKMALNMRKLAEILSRGHDRVNNGSKPSLTLKACLLGVVWRPLALKLRT